MTSIAVLVPVLNRPRNVAPLLKSIRETTPGATVLFIADPHDKAEHEAIYAAGGQLISPGGNYAHKINTGARTTTEPLLVLAADDLRFRSGWLEAAQATMTDGVQVVGLNDLIPRPLRPDHATHFLMTREAANLPCLDKSPGPLYEGYRAWRVDDELIVTATLRGMYAYAPGALVEHLHPMAGKAADDATYRKGRATARIDSRIFHRRMARWT